MMLNDVDTVSTSNTLYHPTPTLCVTGVVQESIPQLIWVDYVNAPDALSFRADNVSDQMIAKAMELKRLDKGTGSHIFMESGGDGADVHIYILRRKGPADRLSRKLIQDYKSMCKGLNPTAIPRGNNRVQVAMESLQRTVDCCQSLHHIFHVDPELEECKPCMLDSIYNPLYLSCTCKGFCHHSICSHIMVAHDLLGQYSLSALSKRVGGRQKKRGRPKQAVGGRHIQPDSGGESEDDIDNRHGVQADGCG